MAFNTHTTSGQHLLLWKHSCTTNQER